MLRRFLDPLSYLSYLHFQGLEIVAAEAMVDGGGFQPTDRVELKLCTLEGDEYWIDKARFSVMWDEEHEDNDVQQEVGS